MMTPQEFASKIRTKYPGAYDTLSDEDLTGKILAKYPQYSTEVATPPSQLEMGAGQPAYPNETYTSSPNLDILQGAMAAPAVAGAVKAIPEAVEAAPDAIRGAISGIKGLLPNPSLRALGYSAGQVGTPAMQDLARAAGTYATEAQPEVGQMVAKTISGASTPGMQALATPEELAEVGAATPPPAGLGSPAQTTIFNQPIAKGLANSANQMLDLATEQWKQVGEAIDNTLSHLDASGTQFDPKPILDKIASMYERNASGEMMTTGVQGETNSAISDALDSLKDYAQGDKISWRDANRIKSMLQDSASYAAKRYEQSNEAYKQVASLIKEGIDDQAGNVLSSQGGNLQDFQSLRGAYRNLSSLKQALTSASGKELLQPSPGEMIMGSVKRALPYVTGYELLRRMF